MIEKVQEKIDKYIRLRSVENIYLPRSACVAKFNLIGEFLCDLHMLLESSKEKKKACCEKKSGKQITVTACRNCPYFTAREIMNDYCGHPKEIGGHEITQHDIVPKWCPL